MKSPLALLLVGLCGCITVHAIGPDRTTMLVDLMRVDAEFNALCQQVGRIDAFLNYMDETAFLVNRATRGKVEAKESFERTDPRGLRLIWGATYADVSASGDLGYTLGPWQREAPSPDGTTTVKSTGMFLTIWKHQPDGSWKFLIDGIGSGMPPDQIDRVQRSIRDFPAPSSNAPTAPGDPVAVANELRDRDRSTSGESKMLTAAFADDVMFLDRAVHSRRAVIEAITREPSGLRFAREPIHVTVAQSTDLAYTWGALTIDRAEPSVQVPHTAIYVHVWKRQADGNWKIVVAGSAAHPHETIERLRSTN